jgi:hypothetical protein
MVEAVRSMTDPVARAVALQQLQTEIGKARRDVSALRTEAVRALRDLRDAEHPEGWSLAEIGELLGIGRSNVQYIAEGRGLSRAADGEGPDAS